MVVEEANINNIMGGMERTGNVPLHNHRRKLKQRFDIIKKLGQGTYGKVQLGINKETGQEVAIKTIKKCKIETEADLIRIRREIQIMSSIHHPNIIHIYEVFENKEKIVLVMEYAAGGELYDYLSQRKILSEQEARRIFRQIAIAVYYCHKHKICHRDLKLENILLDQIGNAKIADFGLSNVFDDHRLLETFCGSPLYASPEIVRGNPYYGPEVDCWSLGVLLYTLVYGAMPFDGSNFKKLVKQICQSDYFEPKNQSSASELIKEMLSVCPFRRANIEKICCHWWVNKGYQENCLQIAKELAIQTPVRLDLLLSLVPQSTNTNQLIDQSHLLSMNKLKNSDSIFSKNLGPIRCRSIGSLLEFDRKSKTQQIIETEPKTMSVTSTMINGEAKRKLETTPSMDDTTIIGVKKKERTCKKDDTGVQNFEEREFALKDNSTPISSLSLKESMDVELTAVSSNNLTRSENLVPFSEMERFEKNMTLMKDHSESTITFDPPKNLLQSNLGTDDDSKCLVDEKKINKSETSIPIQKNKIVNDCEISSQIDTDKSERTENYSSTDIRKLKNRALSIDSELVKKRPMSKNLTDRRRSKIFETAEKFNQLISPIEHEKPKKVFIPGINVGGAKLAFERKASLSSSTICQIAKAPKILKITSDIPLPNKKSQNIKPMKTENEIKELSNEKEEKKRAVNIITEALGKPPVQKNLNRSSSISSGTITDCKISDLEVSHSQNNLENDNDINMVSPKTNPVIVSNLHTETIPKLDKKSCSTLSSVSNTPKKCSKMEITLKSATLPRPRKTTKTEITLIDKKPRNEVLTTIPTNSILSKLTDKTLNQESIEPKSVINVNKSLTPAVKRSFSLDPEKQTNQRFLKECIIPIQIEPAFQQSAITSTIVPLKPAISRLQLPGCSNTILRHSTLDSDTENAFNTTLGSESIKKSPREYIIPIAVEGGDYVKARSNSFEKKSIDSGFLNTNSPKLRFSSSKKKNLCIPDSSEDESSYSSINRENNSLLQRHMHRLRSSRTAHQDFERSDSLSSGEDDDDDDGYELLTAENLFSTLLSRVRSLTQRLNVDDNRTCDFSNNRLLGGRNSKSSKSLWRVHDNLSRKFNIAE